MVIATQNPIEYEGTYPLPEAQLDRFMMRLELGYPPLADEAQMLDEQTHVPPLDSLEPVAGADDVEAAREQAREVYVEESLSRYVVALLRTTRADTRLYLGASPRAGSRCCGSRRRARSPTAATTSCRTTSRRSPQSVLSHRLILAPRLARPGSAAERSSPRRSKRPPFPV